MHKYDVECTLNERAWLRSSVISDRAKEKMVFTTARQSKIEFYFIGGVGSSSFCGFVGSLMLLLVLHSSDLA